MKAIRGTISIAIDTNFIYSKTFIARYKNVTFKYIVGQNPYTDSIVAIMEKNAEYTFEIMSELVSVLAYARDSGFILRGWCHDQYRGDLAVKQTGIFQFKMLLMDRQSCSHAGNAIITYQCPYIDDEHKTNLVRLYRIARAEEYVNPISAFLFYYHIIDYPYLSSPKHVFSDYINQFERGCNDSVVKKKIEAINADRVFEKQNSKPDKYDRSLGSYIDMKVRDSVGHIIRHEYNNAVNLRIDSLTQGGHFYQLVNFMRSVARHKLNTIHKFDAYCDENNFAIVED